MPDEDDFAVWRPPHAAATPGKRADLELEELVVAPDLHRRKRKAANLAKNLGRDVEFGAHPIVVELTTNPDPHTRRTSCDTCF
jgi:hypothetical protein